ncbi:hypothetical protein [Streptomyces sp. NPDC003006]
MTHPDTSEQNKTGFEHPLVRDLYAFLDHLRTHPDDVAALETFIGMALGIRVGLGIIGGGEGPRTERLSAASITSHVKLNNAEQALKFAGGFLHDAHKSAVAVPLRVEQVSAEFRKNLETLERFITETYDTSSAPDSPTYEVEITKVRTDYTTWCKAAKVHPLSDEKFERFLLRPLRFDRKTKARYVRGIKPRAGVPDQPTQG